MILATHPAPARPPSEALSIKMSHILKAAPESCQDHSGDFTAIRPPPQPAVPCSQTSSETTAKPLQEPLSGGVQAGRPLLPDDRSSELPRSSFEHTDPPFSLPSPALQPQHANESPSPSVCGASAPLPQERMSVCLEGVGPGSASRRQSFVLACLPRS